MKRLATVSLATLIVLGLSSCGDKDDGGSGTVQAPNPASPNAGSSACPSGKCESSFAGYNEASPWGRYTVVAPKASQGKSIPIDMQRLEYLCSDMDGCKIRMGLHEWDAGATGMTASREFLFFYNKDTGFWRASVADPAPVASHDPTGTDLNGTVEHVNQTWSCFMTDGEYVSGTQGDRKKGFGLLSWDTYGYRADCWMTIID